MVKKKRGRFFRQELFALNQKFEKWIQISFTLKEIPFGENNKFTLDFSNEEFVQQLSFLKNQDYYISSLNYNLILKESKQFNYKDEKKK